MVLGTKINPTTSASRTGNHKPDFFRVNKLTKYFIVFTFYAKVEPDALVIGPTVTATARGWATKKPSGWVI